METSLLITIIHILAMCLAIVNTYLSSDEPLYKNTAAIAAGIDGILNLPCIPETILISGYSISFDPFIALMSFVLQFVLLLLYITRNSVVRQNTDT
jgi:hypothetical protein